MPRTLVAALLLAAFALAAVACEDSGDFLLEEEPEATGTPAFLERSPEPSPEPTGEASPAAPNATPVAAFQVTTDENVNQRDGPSTSEGVAGTLSAGSEATVIATIRGEAVEGANDIWYQLDDGSYVYSGAVEEVEE